MLLLVLQHHESSVVTHKRRLFFLSTWQIDIVSPRRCIEWHVPSLVRTPSAPGPGAPGECVIRGDNRILHFAPGTWLSLECDSSIASDPPTPDAILTNVTGKWIGLRLTGRHVQNVLASHIAVNVILKNRQCAALRICDCPAVLVLTGEVREVWTHASYRNSLLAALTATACAVARRAADGNTRYSKQDNKQVPQ